MKNFLNEAWNRLNSNTPVFFRKIKKIGVGLGASGGSLVAPTAIPAVHMPDILVKMGGYLIVAGVVMGGVAKMACEDPDSLPTKTDSSPKN
jgi:hypothetical protein